jgi:GTP-binding protein
VKVRSAEFVTSAAGVGGVPRDGLPQLALIGRSNVGKSSLINALVRQQVARTSGAPGKTRLINLYRVTLDRFAPIERFYLVDLPGYGYARGGEPARAGFAAMMEEYFGLAGDTGAPQGPSGPSAALLVVDARHPGLPQDVAAWEWIQTETRRHPDPDAPPIAAAVIASKIDKLSRADRTRALSQWTQQLKVPVLPVSAETGEGLDDLWTLIVKMLPPPRVTRTGTRTETGSAPPSGTAPPSGNVSPRRATRPSSTSRGSRT